jgi:poly(A) polymerase
MLKRLISLQKKLRKKPARSKSEIIPELAVIPRDQHTISRRHISDNALKVMSRLRNGGHQGFLVGGAVRDLLLGKHPKDFDVATDATPEQVHKLFRNSRIIGRRFRIVHVRFGREIIEVTTFRGHHNEESQQKNRKKNSASQHSDSGMLLRDNVYGSLEDDAIRRDFTVNALYYDHKNFCVHDYAGGVEDMNNKLLRIIGDPEQRYREDPVRMLRAVRFAAKLDFDIEPNTATAIKPLSNLLASIPAARLFDEIIKLLMAGQADATLELLHQYGLLQHLVPQADDQLRAKNGFAKKLFNAAMQNTDRRIAADKPVTPAFIYATLLWPSVVDYQQQFEQQGMAPAVALNQAAQQAIALQTQSTTIPRRFSSVIREIWDLQLRLPNRRGRKLKQVVEHPRFRAAYDFLLLREQAGENLDGLGDWWTEYQVENPVPQRPPRERRPRPRNTHNGGDSHSQ